MALFDKVGDYRWHGSRWGVYVGPIAAEIIAETFEPVEIEPGILGDYFRLPSGRIILVGTETVYTRLYAGPNRSDYFSPIGRSPERESLELGGSGVFILDWEHMPGSDESRSQLRPQTEPAEIPVAVLRDHFGPDPDLF